MKVDLFSQRVERCLTKASLQFGWSHLMVELPVARGCSELISALNWVRGTGRLKFVVQIDAPFVGKVWRLAPVIWCISLARMDKHTCQDPTSAPQPQQPPQAVLAQGSPQVELSSEPQLLTCHGAAWRRRQRRLRSWWRHEQLSIAAALATAHRHSYDRKGRKKVVEREVEHEQKNALRGQCPPLPVKRPGIAWATGKEQSSVVRG